MANTEHLEMLKWDIRRFNLWREEHPEVVLDFSGATLAGKSIRERNLSGCNFRRTNLRGANGVNATFIGADFREAEAACSNFEGADFSGADLRGADFHGARLRGSYYVSTPLDGADFGETFLDANRWAPVLKSLWMRARPEAQTELLAALHTRTLAQRIWTKDGRSCPKWILTGGDLNLRKGDDFTEAWDSGALTEKSLLDVLDITIN